MFINRALGEIAANFPSFYPYRDPAQGSSRTVPKEQHAVTSPLGVCLQPYQNQAL